MASIVIATMLFQYTGPDLAIRRPWAQEKIAFHNKGTLKPIFMCIFFFFTLHIMYRINYNLFVYTNH